MQSNNASRIVMGVLVAVLLVGLVIWAVSGKDTDTAVPTSQTTSNTSAPQGTDSAIETPEPEDSESPDDQESAVIAFTNDGFTPSMLTVRERTVVTVRNDSSSQVQFSSDNHPTHRLNEGMNLRTLAPGESATFTAGPVGSHGFHDHIDARHTGTLIVTE